MNEKRDSNEKTHQKEEKRSEKEEHRRTWFLTWALLSVARLHRLYLGLASWQDVLIDIGFCWSRWSPPRFLNCLELWWSFGDDWPNDFFFFRLQTFLGGISFISFPLLFLTISVVFTSSRRSFPHSVVEKSRIRNKKCCGSLFYHRCYLQYPSVLRNLLRRQHSNKMMIFVPNQVTKHRKKGITMGDCIVQQNMYANQNLQKSNVGNV